MTLNYLDGLSLPSSSPPLSLYSQGKLAEPETQTRIVVVNVIQAKGLLAADSNGFSDPYVVLQLEGAIVAKPLKTKVQKSTLDPVWDEEVRIPVRGRVGQLKLKVLDYDLLSGHDFLGFSKIRSAAMVSSLLPTAAWMVYMHGSCFLRSRRPFFADLE